MKEFEIKPGKAAVDWAKTTDDPRLFNAERFTQENTKEARQAKRQARLQVEDESYSAGKF